MATSDAFVARGMSSDIDPAHVYSRDIDPEPKYEDAVDSLSKDDRARTYMVAHAFFRSFSVMLRQRAAMTTFVSEASEFSHAGDETNFFEPAPHFIAMPDPGVAPRSIADRRRGLDASARSGSSCDGLSDVSGPKSQKSSSRVNDCGRSSHRVRTMARTLPPLALPSLALRRPSAETSVSCMRERPNSQQSGDLTCTAGSGRR